MVMTNKVDIYSLSVDFYLLFCKKCFSLYGEFRPPDLHTGALSVDPSEGTPTPRLTAYTAPTQDC